jgi:pantothenate kinase, type III
MNLAIDYGNTRIKAGVFEGIELRDKKTFQDAAAFKEYLNQNSFENVIISSVHKESQAVLEMVVAKGKKIELDHTTHLPISILYKTPETLGVDRIAGACGAIDIFPNRDCLVIDAGTCVNYEFVDAQKRYFGGAISPGIRMRFEAMHTFTSKLPLITSMAETPLIGDSTVSCMQSGVLNGILNEVTGTIEKYKEKYPELGVILCGGDYSFFENKLKPSIFVAPNLVLSGLNRILLHNAV